MALTAHHATALPTVCTKTRVTVRNARDCVVPQTPLSWEDLFMIFTVGWGKKPYNFLTFWSTKFIRRGTVPETMSRGVCLKTALENQSQWPGLLNQHEALSSCLSSVTSFSGWQPVLKMQEMQSTPTANILKLLLTINYAFTRRQCCNTSR